MEEEIIKLVKELMRHIMTTHLDMGGKHHYSLTYQAFPIITSLKSALYELEKNRSAS